MYIFALALGVATLGPLPLPACATLAGDSGDCCPVRQSGNGKAGETHAACQLASVLDPSCCRVSEAPQPRPQSPESAPTVSAPSVAPNSTFAISIPQGVELIASVSPNYSPPDHQSLLCVFLL